MRIEGLVFAGIATPNVAGLAAFFADTLAVESVEEDGYTRFVFPNGSAVAVVPRDWVSPPSDTNLGFLVDDVVAATAALALWGIDPGGELKQNDEYRYRHFRAPDGRVFELLDHQV